MKAWSLGLLGLVLGFSHAGASDSPELIVSFTHLRSGNGSVACALWGSAEGYPRDGSKAVRSMRAPVSKGRADCRFRVPPGRYAVAAYHDENGNGKFDQGFLGIPKEGHAASNDAKGFLGPPSFEKAQFDYPGGNFQVSITMDY